MSLPTLWVERIFQKLTLAYGRDFLGRWEGIPLADVKTDWADCLSGFHAHPESIAFALSNLPDSKPPTAQEFRALCRKAPAPDIPRLPEPKADMARVNAELAKLGPLKAALKNGPAVSGLDWAYSLQKRDNAGERLNMTSRKFYRQALGIEA